MKEKIVLLVAFFVMGIHVIFSQTWTGTFTLNGRITDTDSGKIVLKYIQILEGKFTNICDTSEVADGQFSFKGELNEPAQASIYINNVEISLVLEASSMDLCFSLEEPDNYQLAGSLSNDEEKLIDKKNDELLRLWREKKEELKMSNGSRERLSLQSQIDSLFFLREKIWLSSSETNPQSFISLKYLTIFQPMWLSMDAFQRLYDNYSPKQKETPTGRLVALAIDNKRKSNVGQKAPDFQFYDKGRLAHSLSDFVGEKYVLIDFGAEWCIPCVESISYIKSCFEKYRNRGLIVVSVSLDEDEDSYKKSIIKHDTEEWFHVWNPKNPISLKHLYYVQGIPHFILIDKNGFIVKRWVGISESDKQSMEVELEKMAKD